MVLFTSAHSSVKNTVIAKSHYDPLGLFEIRLRSRNDDLGLMIWD